MSRCLGAQSAGHSKKVSRTKTWGGFSSTSTAHVHQEISPNSRTRLSFGKSVKEDITS